MSVKKEDSKGKKKFYIISFIIIALIGTYWFLTKDSLQETYKIGKSDQFTFKPGKSYINTTGKESEEKAIGLSDGFWTSGKLNF